ncbi:YicC family protein [Clostridium sp. 'deep sea']|uniref:YicC/YloC family endoribonuclease n=1 Tax=Clostridium sp. 'deep sea' TaxID=2779445 RepID=UPI0018964FB8|nr:YicC/YloC family endoribonuclease [Clostridium sp. 'deep sea']QOR36197.1 YicC family protein [Clostridium sp. 'deep sea']
MLQSMTGYGNSTVEIGNRNYTIELKGVNHRYLDIKIRLPREYFQLEEVIRKEISKDISRGRVDVYIHYDKNVDEDKEIIVDKNLAKVYYEQLTALVKEFKMKDSPSIEFIASRPDVVIMKEPEQDMEEVTKILLKAVNEASSKFKSMRIVEAKALSKTMINQLNELESYRQLVAKRSPEVVKEYKDKLQDRIKQLLDKNVEINQDRLCNEVVYFADRSSIDEEVVRLKSHVNQFKSIIEKGGPVGRKLDFLVQEMNREVNTTGAKSSDLEISSSVVEMKSIIEKIREQVQNIE